MKNFTKKQIEKKVTEIFDLKTISRTHEYTVDITIDTREKCIYIDITKMYSHINLSFQHLVKLSEYLGCKEISEELSNSDGCPTCDYGSKYTVRFKCWDFK